MATLRTYDLAREICSTPSLADTMRPAPDDLSHIVFR
jgi:hypothetical protein